MFWDETFWEDIVKSYLASLATGVTLFIIGAGGYVANKKYSIIQRFTQKFTTKSENLSVGNVEGDLNIFQEVNETPVSEQESKDTSADT